MCRTLSVGVQTIDFQIRTMNFHLIDVGGQRNERRKWIQFFEGVNAVIFCVSLSEYDQMLFEDSKASRMLESLLLFTEISNSRWFAHTKILLFFNKDDIFRNKIAKQDLSICFPDYAGGQNYDAALDYIQKRFLKEDQSGGTRIIIPHVTVATDTIQIQDIFEALHQSLID